MFKKEFNVTQSYTLSNKEKKDILKKLRNLDNGIFIDYIQSNFSPMTMEKTSLNKMRILRYENNPIFFEYLENQFLPTIYLLNTFPCLIKKICLIYDETDSYLENGADLMLKGVLNRAELKKTSFHLNEVFAVLTTNGVITSIGITLCSVNNMNVDIPSGKFLKVIHRINDCLWRTGTKKIPTRIILKEENVANEALSKLIMTLNKEEEISNTITNINNLGTENISADKLNEEISKLLVDDTKQNIVEEKKETDHIDDEKEEEVKISPEKMDENIYEIFLTTLKICITDDLLPLDPGKLYKEYMKKVAKELKLPFDIKNSSYKKINNFLKSIMKSHKFITFGKPSSSQNNEYLLSIMKDNPFYQDFIPKILKIEEKEEIENKPNVLLEENESIDIQQLFKPNNKIIPIFTKQGKEIKFYTLKECKDILFSYIKLNKLGITGSNESRLDETMLTACNCYNKIVKKKGEDFIIDKLKNEEIIERFTYNLQEKDFITKSNADNSEVIALNQGSAFKIKITAKKMNNSKVTIVEGLKFLNFDLKNITKIFAKKFACSVSIKDDQVFDQVLFKINNKAVMIQGYWVPELLDILETELKLSKQFIKVDDKLGDKKKKKKETQNK